MAAPKGHPRWGGLKKGFKFPKTLAKEQAREAARQYITQHLQPILQSQVVHALGIHHVYTRDKNGKFTKIEDPQRIDHLLTTGKEGEAFWIFPKDPSNDAAKTLLDRALDKPKEQEQEIKVTGDVALVARLMSARKRLTDPDAR